MAVTIVGIMALLFAAVLMFVTERQKRLDLKRLKEEAPAPLEERAAAPDTVLVDTVIIPTETIYSTMQEVGRASYHTNRANRILTNRSIVFSFPRKKAEKQTA